MTRGNKAALIIGLAMVFAIVWQYVWASMEPMGKHDDISYFLVGLRLSMTNNGQFPAGAWICMGLAGALFGWLIAKSNQQSAAFKAKEAARVEAAAKAAADERARTPHPMD